jgi:hypothetical protein
MWILSAIVQRIGGVVLALALVVAPITPALADCMSNKAAGSADASEASPPCDMPCKDCSSDAEKACQGDCIVATTVFSSTADSVAPADPAERLDPEGVTTTRALVHPPDTPPPRSLLAQF